MSWILSASRASARIIEKQGSKLSLVENISHDEGRLKNCEIDSDRPGRAFDRASSARHAMEPTEAPHERAAKDFAHALAASLKRARLSSKFERLVLVAEPHFLGLLRAELDPITKSLVIASVPKDLEKIPLHELDSHLPELPAPAL